MDGSPVPPDYLHLFRWSKFWGPLWMQLVVRIYEFACKKGGPILSSPCSEIKGKPLPFDKALQEVIKLAEREGSSLEVELLRSM